jgi:mRNA-degrading endonuclease HigB of HigAB toxin-antitoxin module/antitoxin component HigA of HigAB toxin-antitoxin module
MHVISRKALRDFILRHPNSKTALDSWFRLLRANCFDNFGALQSVFPSVDKVGNLFVFNIGGNKYRLIASIHFNRQKIYIRQVLTHQEYNRGRMEKMIATQELTQTWGKLQTLAPVSAIHTEQQYNKALKTLNKLLDTVGDDARHPLYGLLDTLGTLVHFYEEEHYPVLDARGIEVLQFLMDEHQLKASDFPEIGSEQDVQKLLNGARDLSVPEIRVLSRRFGVSPATFI